MLLVCGSPDGSEWGASRSLSAREHHARAVAESCVWLKGRGASRAPRPMRGNADVESTKPDGGSLHAVEGQLFGAQAEKAPGPGEGGARTVSRWRHWSQGGLTTQGACVASGDDEQHGRVACCVPACARLHVKSEQHCAGEGASVDLPEAKWGHFQVVSDPRQGCRGAPGAQPEAPRRGCLPYLRWRGSRVPKILVFSSEKGAFTQKVLKHKLR